MIKDIRSIKKLMERFGISKSEAERLDRNLSIGVFNGFNEQISPNFRSKGLKNKLIFFF